MRNQRWAKLEAENISTLTYHYINILGGCPFHGRVERDEIPTRESPPKQSGTR